MKRFLLIVFGNFKDLEICREIALHITPLVDSPHLKFQFSKGSCIYHFATEATQNEIYEFVQSITEINELPFILTEMNDNVSVSMKKNVYEHLMDLKSDEGSELKLKSKDYLPDFDLSEDEENNLALLLNLLDRNQKPSLDSILEKIKEKGFDSLTQYEKEVLEEYSKK